LSVVRKAKAVFQYVSFSVTAIQFRNVREEGRDASLALGMTESSLRSDRNSKSTLSVASCQLSETAKTKADGVSVGSLVLFRERGQSPYAKEA
jgi:hypothetical protein